MYQVYWLFLGCLLQLWWQCIATGSSNKALDFSDPADVTATYHLVTTILTRKESSWKAAEAFSYNWLASPKLEGISKTVYSADEYLPAAATGGHIKLKSSGSRSLATTSAIRADAVLTPWLSRFEGVLNLTEHNIQVLPLVNPRRAQECPGILTFIIDNYHRLPNVTFFLHGHPFNHNVDILTHIAAMRKWSPDLVGFTHLNNQAYVKTSFRTLRGQEQCVAAVRQLGLDIDTESWSSSTAFAGECCGQFAVSSDRVLAVPLEWFVLARKLVYEGGCCYCFEYLWHFIFGEPAIMPLTATSTVKGKFKLHPTDGVPRDFGH